MFGIATVPTQSMITSVLKATANDFLFLPANLPAQYTSEAVYPMQMSVTYVISKYHPFTDVNIPVYDLAPFTPKIFATVFSQETPNALADSIIRGSKKVLHIKD